MIYPASPILENAKGAKPQTFTPVIADATTGGNLGSAASQDGWALSLGPIVFAHVELINIDTTGMTAGNNLVIRGLPFDIGSGGVRQVAAPWLTSIAIGANYAVCDLIAGTDRFLIRKVTTGVGAYVQVGDLTSGASDIYASFFYFT